MLGQALASGRVALAGYDVKRVRVALEERLGPGSLDGPACPLASAFAFYASLASYLVDPEVDNALPELAERELGLSLGSVESLTKRRRGSHVPLDEINVEELGALSDEARGQVRIIRRQNGGPAAARNTGLAALPSNAEFVALLDCDDLWHPQHLTRAIAAFERGYDFYFSNHRREHARESRFSQCGIRASDHRMIDAALDLYAWEGDLFEVSLHHTEFVADVGAGIFFIERRWQCP